MKLRQMKSIMTLFEKYAHVKGVYIKQKEEWSCEYTKNLWKKIGNKYIVRQFGDKNKNISMAWKTLYNNMEKAKSFANLATQTTITLNNTYI